MTFDEILEQVIALLKRQGRVSYSALKRRFDLNDDYLNDLKDELLFAHPVVDEDQRGLVWTGHVTETADTASPSPQSRQASLIPPEQPAQLDSPPTRPPTPEAERRQ